MDVYPDQHKEPYHVTHFVDNVQDGLDWLTTKANAIGGLVITEGTLQLSILVCFLNTICFQSRDPRRVRSLLNYSTLSPSLSPFSPIHIRKKQQWTPSIGRLLREVSSGETGSPHRWADSRRGHSYSNRRRLYGWNLSPRVCVTASAAYILHPLIHVLQ